MRHFFGLSLGGELSLKFDGDSSDFIKLIKIKKTIMYVLSKDTFQQHYQILKPAVCHEDLDVEHCLKQIPAISLIPNMPVFLLLHSCVLSPVEF